MAEDYVARVCVTSTLSLPATTAVGRALNDPGEGGLERPVVTFADQVVFGEHSAEASNDLELGSSGQRVCGQMIRHQKPREVGEQHPGVEQSSHDIVRIELSLGGDKRIALPAQPARHVALEIAP